MLILLAGLAVYRNWRYEQALDSLLWKVDYRDIALKAPSSAAAASTGLLRTSQASLSSNPETGDFRYSGIFTTVGLYRGRLLAVRKVKKRSVDLTRDMKKELKLVSKLTKIYK